MMERRVKSKALQNWGLISSRWVWVVE
jgi:hypothetical protein